MTEADGAEEHLHVAETGETEDSQNDEDDSPAQRSRRPMCAKCTRPQRACICSSLPSSPIRLPSGLESILLLRHPKERRQKHQSAWILERCVSGVRQHVSRRLPRALQSKSIPSGLEHIYEQPQSCLLVFPGAGARPLRDVLDPGVKHLILVDATWRFAREMAAAVPEKDDPLGRIRRVELSPPPETRPVFVVRKPMLLAREEEEEQWGFSTAEAAALAIDEVAQLRRTPKEDADAESGSERTAWNVVTRALKAYAQIQLQHTEAPRMRSERPGFIPKLYDGHFKES